MTNLPNHNPFNFIRALRRIILPSETRARMRAELSAYVDLHTLQQSFVRASAPVFSMLWFRSRSLYAGALALVLIVAGGTQASFASEMAVPGDILYPMKVSVAEPIAFALTASTEGRAELTARYATRRVDEAATLSYEGKLDEKTADELAARFSDHVDALAKETHVLEANGDIAVSLALRSDLEQKLAAKVEEITITSSELPTGTDVNTTEVAEAASASADRFTARIVEKSLSLATTRERLDSALALDAKADGVSIETVSLAAVLRTNKSEESGDTPSTVLFFAEQPDTASTAGVGDASTTTATTTATTTLEAAPEPIVPSDSPASRFFAPFLKR